ncbi:hypothetical protein [Phenylobacterium deserti]|uniref:Uncharacterized protein n=1 Tax=Phenylobacterium deserti TaxID=1914756 RepID=A0A328AVC7_9CAUL|nr:hypothetical protein [Phenylobacterium deserti]RAK57666.1 hypothetical protein DJ018_06990 [Phenylobacterium deserti]
MTRPDRNASLRLAALLMGGAATLALAGCKIDNRPLLARGETAPLETAYAPAPYDGALLELPEAPPAPVANLPPEQAYLYPERAYRFDRAAYREAPDYGFAYEDDQRWAWNGDDGMMFAEPIDDGYRYYYYEEGDAYPYYVRDDDYGYAYGENGVLLAVFTAAGALLGMDDYPRYAEPAGRYWAHAYDLHEAWRGSPRMDVRQTAWMDREPLFWAAQDRWFRSAESYEPWREFRTRHDNGLHRGWYKERPQPVDYRHAPGAPLRADDRNWRHEGGQERRLRQDRGPERAGREHRGPDLKGARREARQEARHQDRQHGRQEARREERREERRDRGPERQFARAAANAGRDANAQRPERERARPERHERAERRSEHGGGRPMQMAQADRGGGKPDRAGAERGHAENRGGGKPDRGEHGGGHKGGGGGGDKGGGKGK